MCKFYYWKDYTLSLHKQVFSLRGIHYWASATCVHKSQALSLFNIRVKTEIGTKWKQNFTPNFGSQSELRRRRAGCRDIRGWAYFMTRTFDYEGEKNVSSSQCCNIDSSLTVPLERYIEVIQPSRATVKSKHKREKKAVSD